MGEYHWAGLGMASKKVIYFRVGIAQSHADRTSLIRHVFNIGAKHFGVNIMSLCVNDLHISTDWHLSSREDRH